VCIAKTPYSFTSDATRRGAPSGRVLQIRDARLVAGAGFVVMICGDVMSMACLPKEPGAMRIDLDGDGRIHSLFQRGAPHCSVLLGRRLPTACAD